MGAAPERNLDMPVNTLSLCPLVPEGLSALFHGITAREGSPRYTLQRKARVRPRPSQTAIVEDITVRFVLLSAPKALSKYYIAQYQHGQCKPTEKSLDY